MKILYLANRFYPEHSTAKEKIILNLAKMMQRYGHRVKVFTSSFYPPSFYDRSLGALAIKEFVYDSVPVLAFRYRGIFKDFDSRIENEALSEISGDLIRRERPDVVHAGPSIVGELIASAKKLGIPYVMTLTDLSMMCPKSTLVRSDQSLCDGPESGEACGQHCSELPPIEIPTRLAKVRQFLTHAKVIAVPSRFMAQRFQKEFGALSIRVVRNGLSFNTMMWNLRRYGRGEALVFGYAGSLNPPDGVHILIEAFMSVNSPQASLKIYGARSVSEPYMQMLKDIALQDRRIEFCGGYAADQVCEILQNIDLLVTPSLWHESYPLVVNEALACNVPVIASDVGGTSETIQDQFNGFTFRVRDVGHLARVLQTVADTPEMLNAIKDNIGQMVITTVEQEAYTYDRIYTEVCVAH